MKGLPDWLVNNVGFTNKFKQLTIKSVVKQFPMVTSEYSEMDISPFMGYMLTCGGILSHSDNELCQDASLRISQYCLQFDENVSRKDSSALILDTLSNNATLELAVKKGFIAECFEDRLPVVARLESIRRKITQTIELHDKKNIYANRFQLEFWESAIKNEWLSVSAPTSVGKSYILESWVEDYIYNKPRSTIVYLVPTRALISEVYNSLSQRLDPENLGLINIQTLPLKSSYNEFKTNIFVFTQERLNIFYNSVERFVTVDLLIVDEAHKIGDSLRGIFLQYIIEVTSLRNRQLKVIFASPFTSNPELLLKDAPYQSKINVVKSNYITVNQNLIWAEQMPSTSKDWSLYLFFRNEKCHIGDLYLDYKPSTASKRLSLLALTLGKYSAGNIVYVNGAAEAEKVAKQISDGLLENVNDIDVNNLIELCGKAIHERFSLNYTLEKGVAFHYGNMPIIIKGEIEKLFEKGKIKYLVCTSTLVEGVNMACKNIFIRGPKKGNNQPMKAEDFWNLAGRAGRWGKEFQGNVICIDTNDEKLWGGKPPMNKRNIHITRATDTINDDIDELYQYIFTKHHYGMTRSNPKLQGIFSYLCASHYLYDGLIDNPYFEKYAIDNLDELDSEIGTVLERLNFPLEILSRNPGISPILMQDLWERFSSHGAENAETLLLADPSSEDALSSYISAFNRISDTMSKDLGYNSKGVFIVALLVVNWMRGYPLARLISERISYFKKKKREFKEPTLIRNVMEDVENIARYQAPKLLSCYNDLLRFYFLHIDRGDLVDKIENIGVYLELGVSLKTQISLISLGFSRTSSIMISEYITNDSLDELQCVKWIESNYRLLDELPSLVKLEISSIIDGVVID